MVLALSALSCQMSCTYGERGSLTVYCENATSTYFKMTPYRFDHLDETLKCINCTLNFLDSGTFDISGNQIRTVDIRNSSISRISYKAFIGLIFMEKLLLSNNPITSITPGAFIGVRKVKYLELKNAMLNLEDDNFQELRILEVLILSGSRISKLSDGTFNGLANLKILDLSFNQLVTISNNTFIPLVSLQSLQLQNNKITIINGNEFSSLRHMLQLNLEHNVLTNFSIHINVDNRLRILNLAKNRLRSYNTTMLVKVGIFQNLNQLEELYLSQNLLQNIPPKFFQGLFHLRILDLSYNQLKEFATGTFSGLPHLLNLNLSDNHIHIARSSGRRSLHTLHTLDLSDNMISNFDIVDLFEHMPRITTIYLKNNYLPCETQHELGTLLNEDVRRYLMSSNYSDTCKGTGQKAEVIMLRLKKEKYITEHKPRGSMMWVILLIMVIHLVVLSFYIEFFVLHKRESPLYRLRTMLRQRVSS